MTMVSPAHLLGQLLADGGAHQSTDWLQDESLWRIATGNEVASSVAHVAVNKFGMSRVPERWWSSHEEVAAKVGAYMRELDRVADLLLRFEIPIVALKNAGIARALHCAGCCPMGDIDLLIAREDFVRAHEILLKDGYTLQFRHPLAENTFDTAIREGGGEYWKMLPEGGKLWLELQWRPVAGRWLRPDQEPSARELMARSLSIPGSAARILSPEDNLIQVALHTAKHSFVRAPGFRLHLDVDRIVRAYPDFNWSLFVARVIQLGVATPVYFSLALPAELFTTPVPESVLVQLRPRTWKRKAIRRWIHRAGMLGPDESKFSKLGYIIFTSLLYEDLRGFGRGLFPDRATMREQFGEMSTWQVPIYHAVRIWRLVTRRAST